MFRPAGPGQQPVTSAVGNQTHRTEGHHEHSVVRDQGDVAGQQQGGAGTGDGTVGHSDGGLDKVDHLLHEDASHVVEVEDSLGVVQALHLGDVAAGAESAALSVDHHAADVSSFSAASKAVVRSTKICLLMALSALVRIEADDADVPLNAIQYGFQFHGKSLLFLYQFKNVWVLRVSPCVYNKIIAHGAGVEKENFTGGPGIFPARQVFV